MGSTAGSGSPGSVTGNVSDDTGTRKTWVSLDSDALKTKAVLFCVDHQMSWKVPPREKQCVGRWARCIQTLKGSSFQLVTLIDRETYDDVDPSRYAFHSFTCTSLILRNGILLLRSLSPLMSTMYDLPCSLGIMIANWRAR